MGVGSPSIISRVYTEGLQQEQRCACEIEARYVHLILLPLFTGACSALTSVQRRMHMLALPKRYNPPIMFISVHRMFASIDSKFTRPNTQDATDAAQYTLHAGYCTVEICIMDCHIRLHSNSHLGSRGLGADGTYRSYNVVPICCT